jgi:hypothetical protein
MDYSHPLLGLPGDVWRYLFAFIKVPHLARSAALVCQDWYRLS